MNTTEVDIKKACRVNKPLRSVRHLQASVAGGRVSPSTTEPDIQKAALQQLKARVIYLRARLERRNIKLSKVAES